MTIHNIDRFHKCTESQIFSKLSPDTDGVFAYATDTGSLYVSHNGGWVISNLETGVENYEYAGVKINPLIHVDATNTNSVKTIDGDNAGNNDKIHQWQDLTGRNDLTSEQTAAPVLSASAINGKPGIDFSTIGTLPGSRYPSNRYGLDSHQLTSRPQPNRSLHHLTSFVVCYMPTAKPWGDADVRPSSTHHNNQLALPIVSTTNTPDFYSNPAWYVGYKRYNANLDRWYVGSGGAYNYLDNYVDLGPTYQSSEVRVAPKILWSTASYTCPTHRAFTYTGINGGHRLVNRSDGYDQVSQPDYRGVTVGVDGYNIVGEVLLCDQAMTGVELNKIGSYLSNKWNITWTNLPETT